MTTMSEDRRRSSTPPLDPDTKNRYTTRVDRSSMTYKPQEEEEEDQDFLTRVVVDTSLRKFYLYSTEGNSQVVDCEHVEQFMNVLELVRALIKEDDIVYAEPLVTSTE